VTRSITAACGALAGASLLSGCVVVGGSRSDSNGFAGLFFLAIPVLFVFAAFRLIRGAGGRSRRQRAFTDHRAQAGDLNWTRAELSVLADDVLRLEPQVTLNPAARNDYEAALHRYRVAQAALDDNQAPVDLVRVQRVVDEASYSMSRARAILEGRQPPPPPEQLQRQGRHGEPAVMLDDEHQPRYVGSPASFQSGWFALGPGLFGGLLMGSMLTGGMGWFGDDGGDGFSDEAGIDDFSGDF
jgi:hypothetical protein